MRGEKKKIKESGHSGEKKSGRKWSDHILRKIILFTILGYLCFFVFLFLADKFHGILDKIVAFFLGQDNHFSGEIWLSVVFTSIAAIPGISCGALALLQTQKLHKLEERYHRPSLALQKAEMKVTWIRDRQCKRITADYRRDKFVKSALGKDPGRTGANLMSFNLDIEIKNDVGVTDIVLEQIEFIFRNETYTVGFSDMADEWKQYRGCEPEYSKDKYLFHIRWELFPYIITGSKDSANAKEKDTETRFWESVEQFTNFENRLDSDYFSLLTKVIVKVYYEYAPKEYEIASGTISWTADDGEGRHGAEAGRVTHSGIFTYRDTV